MSKKAAIFLVVLLLAGAAAIAIVKTKGGGEAAGTGDGGSGTAKAVTPGSGSGGTGSDLTAKVAERSAREIKDADLVDKYGSTRTNLSRQVSENVVSLLEDAVAMGEMMQGGGGFGGGRMMMRGALRQTGIELSEEQAAKAAELYSAFQKRQLEQSKNTVEQLKKNPSALMELFLAGDAKTRGEMSEDEFGQVVKSAGGELGDVINPLDRNNFRGGRPTEDEEFMNSFRGILDEDQVEQLDTSLAEREAENPPEESAVPESSIANMPTMELETLDEAVGSAKKMTSGFKQVMEGMGSLRELQPQIAPGEGGEGDGE